MITVLHLKEPSVSWSLGISVDSLSSVSVCNFCLR